MMTILGISGLPGSGKDTTADWLINNMRFNGDRSLKYHTIDRISIAKPLRELVYSTFNLDRGRMGDREYESQPIPTLNGSTVKRALQQVGKACTDIYDTVWVDTALKDLNPKRTLNGRELNQLVIVTDVRRPCEMSRIKELGGRCLYILSDRPAPSDGRDMGHESESHHQYLLDNADYYLYNYRPTVEEHYQYLTDRLSWSHLKYCTIFEYLESISIDIEVFSMLYRGKP